MILETLIQALHAHTEALNRHTAALSGAAAPVQQYAPAQQYQNQQPPAQQFAAAAPPVQQPPAQQLAPANVTSDQIMALIQPHIGNEQIKAELGAAMRSQGINALPEAQPHQYGALYQAFQGVIARFTGGGGQQPPAASASII